MNAIDRKDHISRFAFDERPGEFIAQAMSPQRRWHRKAGKGLIRAGRSRVAVALELTSRALEILSQEEARSNEGSSRERKVGWWRLCVLHCLGEIHEALDEGGADAELGIAFPLIEALIAEPRPWLLQDAALRLLARTLGLAPASLAEARSLFLGRIRGIIDARGSSPWQQEAALACLKSLDPAELETRLFSIYSNPVPGDPVFLRARLFKSLLRGGRHLPFGEAERFWATVSRDPSETVRLSALPVMAACGVLEVLRSLALGDPSERVRARAFETLADSASGDDGKSLLDVEALASLGCAILSGEASGYVPRVVLHALRRLVEGSLFGGATTNRERIWDAVRRSSSGGSLGTLLEAARKNVVLRGACAREWHLLSLGVWIVAEPARAHAARNLALFARRVPNGETRKVPHPVSAPFHEPLDMARILSLVAAEDFGFQLRPGPRGSWLIARGHVFGFRLWRFVHELRTPSTDKRQAFPHTIGRLFEGTIHVPSQILCELAQTKVPGEPLYLAEEDGWRPAVPLPDELVSLVFRSNDLTVVTPEGVTRVVPPKGWGAKLSAYAKLVAKFPSFARLRNWTEASQAPANEYVETARAFGFGLSFEPFHPEACASLVRFFRSAPAGAFQGLQARAVARSLTDPATALAGVASAHASWGALQRFVANANANTLGELLLFLVLMFVLFAGSHVWKHVRFRKARAALPLVIGGWGTRGKSGTERLKAALFSAMGFGVVSKTTGCEATLLVAAPFGALKEIPLFRPYDKATIWEQQNVVEFAASHGVNVFLWECMGLTPDYVRILQRSWMKDDISTLTNTYPDHEDVQGPAGVNIPQVMTHFVPKDALLCTTEEQMLPILRDKAREDGTELRAAGWAQASAIPPEILSLFPYEEHPYNIALVLEVAGACGIEPLFALKAMAENVVPDIGVLKTYPTVRRDGRSFSFSNGCSANERHGCQSNWKRLAFDLPLSDASAGTWVSAFVNNRADRVARSQVFARVMVFDLAVDRFYLVGTNVPGLAGFVNECLAEYLEGVDLWRATGEGDDSLESARRAALERLQRQFSHFRLASSGSLIKVELETMLASLGLSGEPLAYLLEAWSFSDELASRLRTLGVEETKAAEIVARNEARISEWQTWKGFVSEVAALSHPTSAEAKALNHRLRKYLADRFHAKMVYVDEAIQQDGDAMADLILRTTPPGFHQRVMGIQNIKGPGLSLIYRLEAWLEVTRLLEILEQGGPRFRLREAAERLQTREVIPAFAREALKERLEAVLKARDWGPEEKESLGHVLNDLAYAAETGGKDKGWRSEEGGGSPKARLHRAGRRGLRNRPFLKPFKELVEPIAAIARRRKADAIYRALAEGRVGAGEAAQRLRRLTSAP